MPAIILDKTEIARRLVGRRIDEIVWTSPAAPAMRSIRLDDGSCIFFWTTAPQEFHFADGAKA